MSNLKNIFTKPVIFMTVMTIFFQLLILLILLGNFIPSPTSQFSNNTRVLSSLDELSPLPSFLEQNSPIPAVIPEDEPQIIIKAVNPGYNTDAGKNSGEFIELANLSGEPQPLGGLAIVYTAKPTTSSPNGKSTILYYFPEGSSFLGNNILLRYNDSPEAGEHHQDLTYDTSLAMAGTLSLVRLSKNVNIEELSGSVNLADFGQVENSLCWLGGEDCLPVFSTTVQSRSYTSIVRNPETGVYEHVTDYIPDYDPDNTNLYLPPPEEIFSSTNDDDIKEQSSKATALSNSNEFDVERDAQCQGLIFSEILSYYDEDAAEQFIELYNPTNSDIPLSGCKIKYKNKYYNISTSGAISALDYYVFRPEEFKLTKNPNTENTLELYDVNGTIIDTLNYSHGQKKSASYAQIGYQEDGTEDWKITYAVTPGEPNVYQQYKSCSDGKVINEATGNCVKAATISSTLADCPAGKYRNPTTGRCKNIESDSETSECKEGYERNPETGRCRKIKTNDGAEYPVVPTTGIEEKSVFIGLIAILGIAILGVVYIIFQFRREIIYFLRKTISKLKH